jgi:hypothetical protein
MDKVLNRIKYIMERFVNEADIADDTDKTLIKLFYNDLSMEGKQKVLEAIDESFDYVDVFTDDVVRDNIEQALSKRPIITVSGEELVNKMDIDM